MNPSAAEPTRAAETAPVQPGARPWSWLQQRWSEVLFVGLASALFAWVSTDAFTHRIVTLSQGADYWEHSATFRALLDNVWHPTNPHLVSPASSPRFVPPFIAAALMAKLLGLDALGAMGVASVLNLLLLLVGIFWFFRSYFQDARASLYGLVVLFTSWYDAWHFSNVYQLKIFFSVVAYPSTAALGLSLIGFAVTLRALRDATAKGFFVATVVCWALVMVTHPLTAMLGFTGAMLLAGTLPRVSLQQRAIVTACILGGGILSLAWPYFSVRGVLVGGGQQELSALLQEFGGSVDTEATHSLHQFYRLDPLLHALGLALLGLPIALYLLVRREHFFISLGAAAMLLPFVVNAYRPLPLGHRFILLAVFFLQVGLVWLLLKLSRGSKEAWTSLTAGRRGWAAGVLVAAVLLTTSWWNIRAAWERVESSNRRLRGTESPNIRYARRVAELAGADSVVLGDAQSSWPVPTFGPKVVLLWHGNPLVPDEAERGARVRQFFHSRTPDSTRLEIIRQYGVTHVLVKRRLAARVQRFLARNSTRNALPAGYSLYTLQVTTPAG